MLLWIIIRAYFAVRKITGEEIIKMFSLMNEARDLIQKEYKPDGFNIGINDGEAAGRTIHHLHIHLIPRYKGDIEKPHGGIRNILPNTNY